MAAFTRIEGASAVMRRAGRYKEVDLFHRAGWVYAATSPGVYVRLLGYGRSTAEGWVWDEILDPLLGIVQHPTRSPAPSEGRS